MSELLFRRNVRVSFGRSGQEGKSVEGLFVQFEVDKTTETNPNRAKIIIHNLNEDSRSQLQENKDFVIRLEAGYDGVYEDLFIGNDPRITHERQGRERITTIEIGDGQTQFKESRVNVTLGPGTTTKQAIEAVATEMKLGIGVVKGLVTDVFQNGITLSGAARDKLTNLVTKVPGLEWNIQDEKINILPQDQPSQLSGIVLNYKTGLLNEPVKKSKKKKEGVQDVEATGLTPIEFQSLMRPSIKPGVAVKIESNQINGFFKVRRAKFEGDSRKGPFMVTCEAIELPANVIETSEILNVATIGSIA